MAGLTRPPGSSRPGGILSNEVSAVCCHFVAGAELDGGVERRRSGAALTRNPPVGLKAIGNPQRKSPPRVVQRVVDMKQSTMHLAPGLSAAGTIRMAMKMNGRRDEVIGLPDSLSFGPIDYVDSKARSA